LKIASHIRILHVEQEVVGDETLAIESVLECDIKRNALLAEEKAINEKFNSPYVLMILVLHEFFCLILGCFFLLF